MTKSYLYEKKKFKWNSNKKCDRVKQFQKINQTWQADRFLSNNHQVHPNESREGRKLQLSEFNYKFREKPLRK
jgi:hypothetical protein